MKKTVIVINGKGTCGKDYLIESLPNQENIFNYSSIDIYKKVAKTLGWSGEKSLESRKFLQKLKQLSIEYNDFPLIKSVEAIKWFLETDNGDLMFLHIREPEEIQKLQSKVKTELHYHIVTLLVAADDVESLEFGNSSDDCVNNYHYDFAFKNHKNSESEKDFACMISRITKRNKYE